MSREKGDKMKKSVAVLMLVMMAVGFNWGLAQMGNDIIQITLKNQFSVGVDFWLNGKIAGSAAANSSCTVRVNIRKAPIKLEAWNDNKVIASHTFDTLAPGKDIIWATGNVVLDSAAQASANHLPVASKDAAVSYMTSVTWLNYQGQEAQNRAQTASLAKVERQTSPTGATYVLSGQGGLQIGKNGTPVYYAVSPVTMNRNISNEHLSSDRKGLGLWIGTINGTLDSITHKRMTTGAWEETIPIPLGKMFPQSVQARFRAQPLPAPDDRWILITAESELFSFRALDPKFQAAQIYGRYQGVLVYSPKEDAFLQAAAAFTLYYGEDKFRIEQLHYAADENGNQLQPILDVGSSLDFKQEASRIIAPGAFPSWCVQATQGLEILHLAMMTAAEGATNPIPIACMSNQALLNLITRSAGAAGRGAAEVIARSAASIEKVQGKNAATEFLRDFAKIFVKTAAEEYYKKWTYAGEFLYDSMEEGPKKASLDLAGKLFWDILLAPFPEIAALKTIMDAYAEVAMLTLQLKIRYDISRLSGPFSWPTRAVISTSSRPEPPPDTSEPTPPPDVPKPTPVSDGGDALLWELLAGLGGAAAAYELGLFGGSGGDVDCDSYRNAAKCIGPDWANEGYTFSMPKSCGCSPNSSRGSSYKSGDVEMITCVGCPKTLGFAGLRSTTRFKR